MANDETPVVLALWEDGQRPVGVVRDPWAVVRGVSARRGEGRSLRTCADFSGKMRRVFCAPAQRVFFVLVL